MFVNSKSERDRESLLNHIHFHDLNRLIFDICLGLGAWGLGLGTWDLGGDTLHYNIIV